MPQANHSAALDEEISRQSMDVCEHVLTEIGAELHDDLIQKLSVFRLYLDRLERSKSDILVTESIITKMNTDFLEVVNAVRRISRRLMPVKIEGDSFQKRITLLCQNLERPGGGTIHLESTGPEKELPNHAETYFNRIIQELIHNAIKHSSAWHIWVRILWEPNYLVIEVEDDGTAFSRIDEFINELRKKYNTLRMRSTAIGAKIQYLRGKKGLLAKVKYRLDSSS